MSKKNGQPVRVSFGKKLLITELVLQFVALSKCTDFCHTTLEVIVEIKLLPDSAFETPRYVLVYARKTHFFSWPPIYIKT